MVARDQQRAEGAAESARTHLGKTPLPKRRMPRVRGMWDSEDVKKDAPS